jgi:hypothetical protein
MNIEKRIEKLEKELAELKAEQYPIYKRNKEDHFIVKFIDLQEGEVVDIFDSLRVEHRTSEWRPHTITKIWEDVPYDRERGFFDRQLILAWNNSNICKRELRFYDAINKNTFLATGERDGLRFDNYEAYKGEYPDWAKEAYGKLED